MIAGLLDRRSLPLLLWFAMLSPAADAAEAMPWQDEGVAHFAGKAVVDACERTNPLSPPPQDQPSEAERAALKSCSSRDLYYGIGVAKDYAAARKCAFREMAEGDGAVIGGPAVLMMSYANGQGAGQDYDLAIKFACAAGGAPAEIRGRVEHVLALQSHAAAGKIDICDDITSGYMGGFCTAIKSDRAAAQRSGAVNTRTASWPVEHRAAFEALQQAADAYFDAHAAGETDLSGTLRGAFMIKAKDTLTAKLDAALGDFEKGRSPAYSAAQFTDADRQLNAVYAATLKKAGTAAPGLTITPDGIRQTERLWLKYLDAWMRFAGLHYPAVTADSVKARLTLERIAVLKGIPVGSQ